MCRQWIFWKIKVENIILGWSPSDEHSVICWNRKKERCFINWVLKRIMLKTFSVVFFLSSQEVLWEYWEELWFYDRVKKTLLWIPDPPLAMRFYTHQVLLSLLLLCSSILGRGYSGHGDMLPRFFFKEGLVGLADGSDIYR